MTTALVNLFIHWLTFYFRFAPASEEPAGCSKADHSIIRHLWRRFSGIRFYTFWAFCNLIPHLTFVNLIKICALIIVMNTTNKWASSTRYITALNSFVCSCFSAPTRRTWTVRSRRRTVWRVWRRRTSRWLLCSASAPNTCRPSARSGHATIQLYVPLGFTRHFYFHCSFFECVTSFTFLEPLSYTW